MGAFSLGQFLLREQVVDERQLRAALDLLDRENPSLGSLATAEGLVSDFDAERILHAQRQSDRSFSDVTVELGLLTREQTDRLEEWQRAASIGLIQALIRLEHLTSEGVTELETRYARVADAYEPKPPEVPDELRGIAVAEAIVKTLPCCARRIAGLEAEIRHDGGAPAELCGQSKASLTIRSSPEITVTLFAERDLAEQIAAGMLGFEREELGDELVEDGLAEFLNIVAGDVTTRLEREGVESSLEAPEPGIAGPPGTPFRISTLRGAALVHLCTA